MLLLVLRSLSHTITEAYVQAAVMALFLHLKIMVMSGELYIYHRASIKHISHLCKNPLLSMRNVSDSSMTSVNT